MTVRGDLSEYLRTKDNKKRGTYLSTTLFV